MDTNCFFQHKVTGDPNMNFHLTGNQKNRNSDDEMSCHALWKGEKKLNPSSLSAMKDTSTVRWTASGGVDHRDLGEGQCGHRWLS